MLHGLHHKAWAFLLVLALFASLAPRIANAAPAEPVMTMTDGKMMNCDQPMPDHQTPGHQMPCDDGSTCLGMLGCAVAAILPPAVRPSDFVLLESSWPPQADLDGLFLRPALPPPIA
jgi:hypothetical protein